MEAASQTSTKSVCGPRVRVSYAWKNNKLIYAEITRTDGPCLRGFPENSHFLVKVEKALVKTGEKVKLYKHGNYCTLKILKHFGSLSVTDMDMDTINMNCELQETEKMEQIKNGQTFPVVAEKLKTRTIFTQLFQPDTEITCEYEPHSPELLDKHLIDMLPDYDIWCKTANRVNISPPFVLFYGDKYVYKIDMQTDCEEKVKEDPIMVIIFYGHVYDTTNRELTGYDDWYFNGLTPRNSDEAKKDPQEYISDIDDYDKDTDDEESTMDDFCMQPVIVRPTRQEHCASCTPS